MATAVEKMSIEELEEAIMGEQEQLEKYKEQDESNFKDFEKSFKGKKVNIPLVKNHIAYYKKEIEKRKKQSIFSFI